MRSIIKTSWVHIMRAKYTSLLVIGTLIVLFLTILVGIRMIQVLHVQRDTLVQNFTYPLFLQNPYTFDNQHVTSFIESIREAGVIQKPVFISKTAALDAQIKRDPSILRTLGGQNPLPDILMVPLYGADIGILWTKVQDFRYIFETVQSPETIRTQFNKFESSIDSIERVTLLIFVFLVLTVALIFILIIMIVRYHMKLFKQEYVLGRLMGAEPYFLFLPHAITIFVYSFIGYFGAWGLFTLLRTLF